MMKHHVVLSATLFPVLLSMGPQQAPADSPDNTPPYTYVECPLQRIDTQPVRCDNLTGGGVDAPFWIPDQE